MRLLLDEMIPIAVAVELRRREVDAAAVVEGALRTASDEAVFERAQEEGRILVTYDRDYLTLDLQYRAAGRTHHGIVMVNWHRFPQHRSTLVGALVRSLAALAEGEPPQGSFVHWLQ